MCMTYPLDLHRKTRVGDRLPIGVPMTGVRLGVVDRESGRMLDCGRSGTVTVKTRQLFVGYWR